MSLFRPLKGSYSPARDLVEWVLETLLIILEVFFLVWLDLPSVVNWLILAATVLMIIAARLFRRHSSRAK